MSATHCTCRPTSPSPCSFCNGDHEPDPEFTAHDKAVRHLAFLRERLENVLAGIMDSERHECGYDPLDPDDSCHWADGPDGSACVQRECERLAVLIVKGEAEVARLRAVVEKIESDWHARNAGGVRS